MHAWPILLTFSREKLFCAILIFSIDYSLGIWHSGYMSTTQANNEYTLAPLQMLKETYFGETGMARQCRSLKQEFLVMLAQMDGCPMEMKWREGGESLEWLTKYLIAKEWEPTLNRLIEEFAAKLNVGIPHWETAAIKLASR